MAILYALVARQKVVLAEYTGSYGGNFPTVTRSLLSKIPTHNEKMSIVYDRSNCRPVRIRRVRRAAPLPLRPPTHPATHTTACRHVFHYIVHDDITFMCMAEQAGARAVVAFRALDR